MVFPLLILCKINHNHPIKFVKTKNLSKSVNCNKQTKKQPYIRISNINLVCQIVPQTQAKQALKIYFPLLNVCPKIAEVCECILFHEGQRIACDTARRQCTAIYSNIAFDSILYAVGAFY